MYRKTPPITSAFVSTHYPTPPFICGMGGEKGGVWREKSKRAFFLPPLFFFLLNLDRMEGGGGGVEVDGGDGVWGGKG